MTDLKIYQLSENVISSIVDDLQNVIYSELNGNISIVWSEEKRINAWAESRGNINDPPFHIIGFHYELVRQIYRDIEVYCEYIESKVDNEIFNMWFEDDAQPFELLTSHFSKETYQNNIFMGAITWVFFHELGHLVQEHGHIRNKFIGTVSSKIHECNINTSEKIKGKEAAVYHATEMAADFEGINFCILELIRQFKGEDLKPAIYEFVCGVSCVLYRFHGSKEFIPEYYPEGSHPNPLTRLESIVSQIYECFSISELAEVTNVELTRKNMVKICGTAATTVGIFSLRNNSSQPEIPDNYFLMGSLNRPGYQSYLKVITETWDEIDSTIRSIKRFRTNFLELRFPPKSIKIDFNNANKK